MPTPLKEVKKPRKKTVKKTEEPIDPAKAEMDVPEIPSFYKVELKSTPTFKVQEKKEEETVSLESSNTKRNSLIISILVFVCLVGVYFVLNRRSLKQSAQPKLAKMVITDQLYVPETERVNMVDARMTQPSKNAVPLDPASAGTEVVATQAKMTLKSVYDLTEPDAVKWSPDAGLAFIKSLGTVTPEGKSTEWQVVFYSEAKKKSLEIIVWEDKVQSQKELDSTLVTGKLPKNWYDSSGAVGSLLTLPQYSSSTISAVNFFYNSDAGDWMYVISTSIGNSSMHVI